MHPCRQFPGHLVFALLFCVARPLPRNWGREGTVTWGRFPRGCEGTVTCSHLLDKGGGGDECLLSVGSGES